MERFETIRRIGDAPKGTESHPDGYQEVLTAFGLLSMIPKVFPSVSMKYAKYPTPGIAVFDVTISPPASVIFPANSSTDETLMVFTVFFWVSLVMIEPSIPGSVSGPVVANQ